MNLKKHLPLIILIVIAVYLLYRLYRIRNVNISVPEYIQSSSSSKSVVYSYSPSCGHCIKFSPVWDKFANIVINRGDGTKVEKVNCAQNPERCVGIHGVPDVVFYVDGKKYNYDGERTTSGLVNFLDKL